MRCFPVLAGQVFARILDPVADLVFERDVAMGSVETQFGLTFCRAEVFWQTSLAVSAF